MAMTAARDRACPYVPWSLEEIKEFFHNKEIFSRLPHLDTLRSGPEWSLRGQISLLRPEAIVNLIGFEGMGLDIGLARTDTGVVILTRHSINQTSEESKIWCPELFLDSLD
jgi:hypothetical protein